MLLTCSLTYWMLITWHPSIHHPEQSLQCANVVVASRSIGDLERDGHPTVKVMLVAENQDREGGLCFRMIQESACPTLPNVATRASAAATRKRSQVQASMRAGSTKRPASLSKASRAQGVVRRMVLEHTTKRQVMIRLSYLSAAIAIPQRTRRQGPKDSILRQVRSRRFAHVAVASQWLGSVCAVGLSSARGTAWRRSRPGPDCKSLPFASAAVASRSSSVLARAGANTSAATASGWKGAIAPGGDR